MLGFDDYADISTRLQDILAGETHVPHVPSDRRRLLPLAPADRAQQPRPARPDLPDGVAPASGPRPVRMRLGDGPTAALKLASGCDRRCTFCAIPTFRGSFVSRRPHEVLTEAALAGRAGRPRAGPGQRELHVVRQGPRRPAAARDAAAGAGRGRRHRAGPGELPAAGRDAARPDRGDDRDAGCAAVLRPVLPARQRPGAAPDAPVRRHRALPRALLDHPGGGTDRRHPVQRDRGLPRGDRGRPRRARAVPGRCPPRRRRGLRLLGRGRHGGGDPRRPAGRRRGPRPGRRG